MMSGNAIRNLQLEAAARAARVGVTPLVIWPEDNVADVIRHIPNIGDYIPKGWRLDSTMFVDKTGLGATYEPAMTFERLCEEIKAGKGYAIVEEGQFQVYIGEFTPPRAVPASHIAYNVHVPTKKRVSKPSGKPAVKRPKRKATLDSPADEYGLERAAATRRR